MDFSNSKQNFSGSKLMLSPIFPTPMRMNWFKGTDSAKRTWDASTPKQSLKLINLFGANTPTPLLKLKKLYNDRYLDNILLEDSPDAIINMPMKPKIQYTLRSLQKSESECSDDLSENAIKRRKRKSNQQIRSLKAEYTIGTLWSKEKIEEMAKSTGLSEAQVYKWCWDQKKKYRLSTRHKGEKGYELREQNKQLTAKDKYILKRKRSFDEKEEKNEQIVMVSKKLHFN